MLAHAAFFLLIGKSLCKILSFVTTSARTSPFLVFVRRFLTALSSRVTASLQPSLAVLLIAVR